MPIYLNLYAFHVPDPDQYLNPLNGIPTTLVEVGPYSFEEYMKKHSIIETEGEYLHFGQEYSYFYTESNTAALNCVGPEGDPCTANDRITIINPILPSVSEMVNQIDCQKIGETPGEITACSGGLLVRIMYYINSIIGKFFAI